MQLTGKSSISIKGVGKGKAMLISGGGDLLSYPNGHNLAMKNALVDDQSLGIEVQPDVIALGALAADTAPTTVGFPIDSDDFDLDSPTEGFSSIPEAFEDIRQGKVSCLSLKWWKPKDIYVYVSSFKILYSFSFTNWN